MATQRPVTASDIGDIARAAWPLWVVLAFFAVPMAKSVCTYVEGGSSVLPKAGLVARSASPNGAVPPIQTFLGTIEQEDKDSRIARLEARVEALELQVDSSFDLWTARESIK